MKGLLAVGFYFAEVPLAMWLYYRCLEGEERTWKKAWLFFLGIQLLSAACHSVFFGIGEGAVFRAAGGCLHLFSPVILFLAVLLWSNKGVGKFVKAFLFSEGASLILRGIGLGFWNLLNPSNGPEKVSAGVCFGIIGICWGTAVIVLFLLAWVLQKRFYERLPGKVWNWVALVLLGILLALEVHNLFLTKETMMVSLILFFGMFGLFFGVTLLYQQRVSRSEGYYLDRQKRLFADYYGVLDRQGTLFLQSRHDLEAYLREMKRLTGGERTEEMDRAAKRLLDEYEWMKPEEYCNNRLVNGLLKEKLKALREQKIRVKVELEQFDGGYVENTDWLWIFYSLLEDAISALKGAEKGGERSIRIRSKSAGGFEAVVFRYPKPKEERREGQRDWASVHVLEPGLHTIKEIAEKYGGTVLLKEEGHMRQVTVSLHVKERRREKIV